MTVVSQHHHSLLVDLNLRSLHDSRDERDHLSHLRSHDRSGDHRVVDERLFQNSRRSHLRVQSLLLVPVVLVSRLLSRRVAQKSDSRHSLLPHQKHHADLLADRLNSQLLLTGLFLVVAGLLGIAALRSSTESPIRL